MTTQADQAAADATERAHIVTQIGTLMRKRDEELANINGLLADRIEDARAVGATWPMIAEAMGDMTVNGVREFYRRHADAG